MTKKIDCPGCGGSATYVGMTAVEGCTNKKCVHFDEKAAKEKEFDVEEALKAYYGGGWPVSMEEREQPDRFSELVKKSCRENGVYPVERTQAKIQFIGPRLGQANGNTKKLFQDLEPIEEFKRKVDKCLAQMDEQLRRSFNDNTYTGRYGCDTPNISRAPQELSILLDPLTCEEE